MAVRGIFFVSALALFGTALFSTPAALYAHEEEGVGAAAAEEESFDLEARVTSLSIQSTLAASVIVIILLVIAAILKEETELQKALLFWPIALVVILNTAFISGLTIYLNSKSFTKGPVHWHAAFEIYGCGQRIELVDPTGFSSKVGSPTLHEHNDNWIHLEGVPIQPRDASVGKFLKTVGIVLQNNQLSVPIKGGRAAFTAGETCSGERGFPQAFLYTFKKINGGYEYTQRKFVDTHEARDYVITHTGNIPPGDCLIFEFDRPKAVTDKLCNVYEAARQRGELKEAGRV